MEFSSNALVELLKNLLRNLAEKINCKCKWYSINKILNIKFIFKLPFVLGFKILFQTYRVQKKLKST